MRYLASTCAAALAGGLLTGTLVASAFAQVADAGKYPDLRGAWDRTGPPNNWRQLAGPPPLTPEYQKVYEKSMAEQKEGKPGNWPSTYCVPEGMPAMMNLYNPMEMIVTPQTTYILMSHNNDGYRRIYTDGRDWPKDPERTLAGYSIGRWIDQNGDGKYTALAVETRFLSGPRAYQADGMPFAADNQTIIKELFSLDKADPNTMYDQITVIDNSLTRPYTKLQKIIRKKDARPAWIPETCPVDNVWVRIGDEAYVVNNANGKLMPAYKDQPPPDLTYFGAKK